jgi:biopolymer transport protein ExbD
MDPDVHARFRIAVMFSLLSIFFMIATFPAASMARENAAGSREQGDNAY